MEGKQERWECPSCGTPLNIAGLGIYAKVACPACGHIDHVHTMLANFRLEGVLGLGGMSVVLRARDLVLERPLAIKLLNEFYRDQPERIARFERECELMAKVRHENVVSLYSAGSEKGQFYIAMELINGRNLEELIREDGPMEPLQALGVISQVVQGLNAACKAGLLHRDMKPANVLICEDGKAKVLDFGLSHGKRDSETEEIIWATPYYVPPETLKRETEDLRTDIYALGMTLRYLLTGNQTFDRVPENIEDMLACKQALPPMAAVLPSLPEAYCDLVDHMTAYEPDARPESYASLMLEVDEVRASLEAEQQSVPMASRLRRALPLLAGAAATLALGAAAAGIVAYVSIPEPEVLYATPPAKVAWVERDTLDAAMEHLKAGKCPEAAALMAELADSEGEPAACAWASLHVAMLANLLGDEAAAGHHRERLQYHLSRTPAPAGQEVHGRLAAFMDSENAPEDKVLQISRNLSRAEKAVASCREQEAKQHLQAARVSARGAGSAYASVVELLLDVEQKLAATLPERAGALCRRSLALLDTQEAARALALLETAPLDARAKERLAVQKEAFTLFSEAVDMMKRRSLMPPAGKEVEPEQLQSLLRPLGDPALAAELATLMLVAAGDMDGAASRNPYAKAPSSAEPFAVMMHDWLSRASDAAISSSPAP